MKLATSATILFSILPAIVKSATNGNTLRCVKPDTVDYSKDYFPDKIESEFSKLWEMEYYKTYKVLRNKKTDTSYALYQCGTELPAGVASQHDGNWAVPLQDGLALSQPATVPQVEQLGIRRQVKGYMGPTTYISSPCMKTLAEEPTGSDGTKILEPIYEPGYYGGNTFNGTILSEFLETNPDIAILKTSGVGGNIINWNAYEEDGNKATFEWHKVMGSLFNLEKLANEQFEASSDRWDCVSDNAAYLQESATSTSRRLSMPTTKPANVAEKSVVPRNLADASGRPTVLWAKTIYGGGGFDVARCDPEFEYYCELAEACSSTLLHSNDGTVANPYTDGEFHMTTEEFIEFGKDADIWIIPDFLSGDLEEQYFWSNISEFKSVKSGNVYDVQKSGGGAWFDQRTAEYDILLQDFCDVVGLYDDTVANHERLYFRKIMPSAEAEQPGNLGTCSSAVMDLPWETRAAECEFIRPEESSAGAMKVMASVLIAGLGSMLML